MSRYNVLMSDLDNDPLFGATMQSVQRMNHVISPVFDPFGSTGPPPMLSNPQLVPPLLNIRMPSMRIMPFEFPLLGINMDQMISNVQNTLCSLDGHSFTSSSVTTMTTGPDGRPQVYQRSMSSRTGPGGVKETKQSVSDSRTGTRKMAIGHHIGERAHIIEREKNEYTGNQEERQDFINLEEEEAESFNQEWRSKTRRPLGAIGHSHYRSRYNRALENRPLALPSTVPSENHQSQSRVLATPRHSIKNALSSKKNKNKDSSRSAESTSTSNSATLSSSSSRAVPSSESPQDLSSSSNNRNSNCTTTTTTTTTNNNSSSSSNSTSRKREHSPEIEEIENPNQKRRSYGSTNDEN